MADEPTVEAPTVEQPADETKAELSQDDVNSLISTLEGVGVTTPEKIESTVAASRQAGQTANLLGEARNEIKGLREEMALLRTSQPVTPDTTFDEFSQPAAPQVDIKSEVKKGINEIISEKEQQAAVANRIAAERWNSIGSDANYPHVKDVWEAKIKDPTFVYRNPDPVKAYNETVIEFYKGLSIRAAKTLKAMQGGTPVAAAPSLESTQVTVGAETNLTKQQEKLQKTQEGVNTGKVLTEDDELAALDAVLGTDQPLV